MTSLPTTPPLTRARLPTPAEMDEMCGRAFLEAFKELREEREPRSDYELDDVATKVQFATLDALIEKQDRDRTRLIHALKTRAWDLACHRMTPGHA